jgi:hypothetical protein
MITTQIHFLNAENKNPPQTTTIERKPVELIPTNKFFQNCKNALALNQQKQQPPHSVASYSVSHLRCDWRHLKPPPNLSYGQFSNQKVVGTHRKPPINTRVSCSDITSVRAKKLPDLPLYGEVMSISGTLSR